MDVGLFLFGCTWAVVGMVIIRFFERLVRFELRLHEHGNIFARSFLRATTNYAKPDEAEPVLRRNLRASGWGTLGMGVMLALYSIVGK